MHGAVPTPFGEVPRLREGAGERLATIFTEADGKAPRPTRRETPSAAHDAGVRQLRRYHEVSWSGGCDRCGWENRGG